MTFNEACIIAEDYIKLNNEDSLAKGNNFIMGISEAKEYSYCYYFGFKLLDADGSEYTGGPRGGAPGFIVSKQDRKAQTITFGMWGRLKEQEEEIGRLGSMLYKIKADMEPFENIKNQYKLNPKQLLVIKNSLDGGPFRRSTVVSLFEMINKSAD